MTTLVVLALSFIPIFARWKGKQDKRKQLGEILQCTFGTADVAEMGITFSFNN